MTATTSLLIDEIAGVLERRQAPLTPTEIAGYLNAPAETVQSAIDAELALRDAKVRPADGRYLYNPSWRIRQLR